MNKKILIIDDHGHIRFMVSNRLSKLGFETVSAEDAQNIVHVAIAEKPDLIIMDLMLPGIDGIEATKQLKRNQETEHIPVIMLTAVSTKRTVMESLKSGVCDYIIKPFKADELYNKIVQVIGEPDSKDEDRSSPESP